MFASPVACLISPSAAVGSKPVPGLVMLADQVVVAADQLVADAYPLANDVSLDGAPISLDGLLEAAPAAAGRLQVDGPRVVYRRTAGYGGNFAVGYSAQTTTGGAGRSEINFVVAAPSGPVLTFPKDPPASIGSPVSATPSTLATVYAAANAGQHIMLGDGDYTGDLTLGRTFDPTTPVVIRAANPGVPRLTGRINVTGRGHWLHELELANVPTGLDGLGRSARLAKMQVQVTTPGDRYLWITRCFLRSEIAVRVGPGCRYVWIGWNQLDGQLSQANGAHIDLEQGLFTDAAAALHDVLIYRNDFLDEGRTWLGADGKPVENHHVLVYQDYAAGSGGLRSLRNVVIAENRFTRSRRRCWALAHLGCDMLDNHVDMPDSTTPTAPVITPTNDFMTLASDGAWAEANVLANDTVIPAVAGLKVAEVRAIAGAGPSGSGLVVPTIVNLGSSSGNNLRVTRNAEPAGTVRVQYRPATADGTYVHPNWVDVNVTINAAATAWWNFTGMRSDRTNGRRSGISYWGASSSVFAANLDKFERQVALCDAWNGGQPDAADATMDLVTGGPNDTDNDTITARSALDWSGSSSHWRAGWSGLPGGTIAIWACNLTSSDRATWSGSSFTGDQSIWTDIVAGTFDRHYTNMGRRIRKNFDTPALNPRGHLPSRLLIRMNHENNQSNYYRVKPSEKANYVAAMNRAIDKIRIGLGPYANDVKFMHAPAHGSEGQDLGSYASWCPSNVDVVSVSWHPRAAQNSAAALDKYNAGTDAALSYGLTELLAYSISTGKPMCFPEWSPRYEAGTGVACPVADLAISSFDVFLTANASRIICDCVYNQRTLDPNAYEPSDTAGKEAWARSVEVYKAKWSSALGAGAWSSPTLVDASFTPVVMATPGDNSDLNFAALANRVYDGRGKTFTHNSNYDDAVNVTAWPTKGAITGLKFVSAMDLTLKWKQIKSDNNKDVSAIRIVTPGEVIIEGIAVYGFNDVARFTPQGDRETSHYILRHSYGRNIRDDFAENDQCTSATIEDCLADGTFGFYSQRPGSGAGGTCSSPQKTVNIRRCVVEIKPFPYNTGTPSLNGNIFKNGGNMGPVNVSGCVFLVHQPPVGSSETQANGKYTFPPSGTFSGNIICWLGTAVYGSFASNCKDGVVPAGFTVVTSRTAYDNARAAWLAVHGSTDGDDFPWLHP